MATSSKMKNLSSKCLEDAFFLEEEEEESPLTMFDVFDGRMREKIVLQRLIVIARLPHNDLTADRTELGAHYEKLNLKLSKQYKWDQMTGLLLIYPSCLLHVVESSREVLVAVLKDLTEMQRRQSDGVLLEAPKVVFMANDPESRLFQQWSYKVLNADQLEGETKDEEGSTESLVCCVLSALQNLSEQLETSKALPGSVLDETPELIVSQEILNQLLDQEKLQSPEQYLQAYDSPLNVSMDFGQVIRSSSLTTV